MSSLQEAARFLMQATLGADHALVEWVAEVGIEPWLNGQLDESPGSDGAIESPTAYLDKVWSLWRGVDGERGFRAALREAWGEEAINGVGNNPALAYKYYFRMAWWHLALSKGALPGELYDAEAAYAQPSELTGAPALSPREADWTNLVRQRVAQALSEIVVVSDASVLELDAEGLASFYDILYRNAFGRFTTLLEEVSLHPVMGVYLSHMNNRRGDPAQNLHPDENYAREIMQLFSIGLFELNPDGTPVFDDAGLPVPTYDNRDIKTLARVFTGFTAAGYSYEWPNAPIGDGQGTTFGDFEGAPIEFGDGISEVYKRPPFVDMISPMALDDRFHDLEPKQLLNGRIDLPARTAGANGEATMADVRAVVEALVAHPSTAPFIATRLIQQLVTSNPLPAYVAAVAEQFGPEGDLKAAVHTVLTWPLSNPVSVSNGAGPVGVEKLKSPLMRAMQILRGFNVSNASRRIWSPGFMLEFAVSQHPVSAPTVFNFYKPDFAPHGPIADAGKVAPEFELHNASTAIGYVNLIYDWVFGEYLPMVTTVISSTLPNVPELDYEATWVNEADRLQLDLTTEIEMAADASQHDALISRICVVLTGKTSVSADAEIRAAIEQYDLGDPQQLKWLVQTIIFLVAISPEFTVLEA